MPGTQEPGCRARADTVAIACRIGSIASRRMTRTGALLVYNAAGLTHTAEAEMRVIVPWLTEGQRSSGCANCSEGGLISLMMRS